jgi:hypothetical protein
VDDPYRRRITTERGIAGQSTLRAITDASGQLLLANPEPGQLGNLGSRYLEGPGAFNLDLALFKVFRVSESRHVELRADFINATNTPSFGNPVNDINSLNFGRINATASGPRIIILGARFNF